MLFRSLVPNTLDFGVDLPGPAADLQTVLPLQAIHIAARLGHWVAENAKTTRAFLKRVDPLVALHQPLQTLSIVELPRAQKGQKQQTISTAAVEASIDALLAPALQGSDMGLISEAGLPAVADPGASLVEAAHRLGITVVPLSGPSALMMALSASGLNGQSFAFVGYLPVESAQRIHRLRELEALSKRHQQTQIMIETPYRNQALLAALLSNLSPNCRLSISCGLTLPDGWSQTRRVSEWKRQRVNVPNDTPAVFVLLAD